MALAQSADAALAAKILARLEALEFAELTPGTLAQALHALQVCSDRSGENQQDAFAAILPQLEPLYPHLVESVNRQLAALLLELDSPQLVPRSMQQLRVVSSQAERMQYLFVLRNATEGWTPALREEYLTLLGEMDGYVGGDGMPGFADQIRQDALKQLAVDERPRWVQAWNRPTADVELDVRRPFVQKWTLADMSERLHEVAKGRDFAQGKEMFAAAQCARCHRLGGKGAVLGPDLTSARSRYTPRNLLESVLSPSLVVAEKYRTDLLVTEDGRVLTGRIVPSRDFRSSQIRLAANPLKPSEVVEVAKEEIAEHHKSTVSIMPQGLLDTLTAEQMLDLLAYILAAGDAEHPSFREH